ncbi:MAG: twin-arginine translocation signal domain-containing protein, partial [Anaerolineae bacterium]|nr:twin-arginine translocation signal domain-containing protein [Anaerolineae bacterium]
MEEKKLTRRRFLTGAATVAAASCLAACKPGAPGEPTKAPEAPVATQAPAEKPTAVPTKQGFAELEPPPEARPRRGEPLG